MLEYQRSGIITAKGFLQQIWPVHTLSAKREEQHFCFLFFF